MGWCLIVYVSIAGIELVKKCLRVPCLTIARNTGTDAYAVVEKVLAGQGDFGYDALNNEFTNLIERGIIDPTKVSDESYVVFIAL